MGARVGRIQREREDIKEKNRMREKERERE